MTANDVELERQARAACDTQTFGPVGPYTFKLLWKRVRESGVSDGCKVAETVKLLKEQMEPYFGGRVYNTSEHVSKALADADRAARAELLRDHPSERESQRLAIESAQLKAQSDAKRADLDRLYVRGEFLFNTIAANTATLERIEAERLTLANEGALRDEFDRWHLIFLSQHHFAGHEVKDRDDLLGVLVSRKIRLDSLKRLADRIDSELTAERAELVEVNKALDATPEAK
jgi:hypothetical protein